MRAVWIFVDGEPKARVDGFSQWTIRHKLGSTKLKRSESNRGYLIEWAREIWEGEITVGWSEAVLDDPPPEPKAVFVPEKVWGDGEC